MKRLLMITVAALAFAGTAFAGNLFDEDGKHIGTSVDRGNRIEITYDDGTRATDAFYVLNGRQVSVFTYPDGTVEMRWVAQPGDHVTGLLFQGEQVEGVMVGTARLDRLTGRRGCGEWFKASILEDNLKTGNLRLKPDKGGPAKCTALFRPVTTYRSLGR
jgi:hypothetical protein